MKKLLVLLLVLVLSFSVCLVSCNKDDQPADNNQNNENNAPDENGDTVRVMSHADYMAAELDSTVVVEAYVQGAQGWWNKPDKGGVITVYLQDNVGGYFAYELACTEENAAKLTPGTKIRITGTKAEFNGEVEIVDGTFEFLDETDRYVAKAYDITSLLGTDAVETHMNELITCKALTVVPKSADKVVFYNWDGSGSHGNDIYFDLTDGEGVYTFVIESYLTGADTAVYKKAESLEAGAVVDVEGFLYWYEGMQAHVTSIKTSKVEGAMTYDEFVATENDMPVVIDAYVQATQGWWNKPEKGGVITMYLADRDGAYFAYEVLCSEENAALLVPGTRVKISGDKATWSGEVEVMNGTLEIIGTDTYIAPAKDLTALLGTADIAAYMNARAAFKGLTVVAKSETSVIYYNWDGSGEHGNDIYFDVTDGEKTYTFVIESYLTGPDSEVYAIAEALQAGDVIDIEAFLYYYEVPQPHTYSITLVVDEPAEEA